tara:strand:+ start:106999 stop:107274 length:276 start_codon:yes stop_codon:yes gene_type:complete
MFFAPPPPAVKTPALSKTRWSKGVTHDGYHVRAGQLVSVRPDLLPEGAIGHVEKVSGVDSKGNAYSGYAASAWRGKPIPLKDCVTEVEIKK